VEVKGLAPLGTPGFSRSPALCFLRSTPVRATNAGRFHLLTLTKAAMGHPLPTGNPHGDIWNTDTREFTFIAADVFAKLNYPHIIGVSAYERDHDVATFAAG
jgi:hypothetical protein